jgi:serine/threonine protein kinase
MLELAPGTALGAYVITARIGRGGMASVYQAHHPALDRNVAIKVLWDSLAEQSSFLERFRREARAASRLRHPNILTVYDFGESDGIAYMVTELLPGGTLADRLGRPLPYTEILRVLRAIGAALDVAHEAGLIHRDVKPSNILFTRDGEPVLADFGIARLVEPEDSLTLEGALIGTPHYMAPEMASGGGASEASDLYSLGVVLYEMLVGEPPFPRETPIAVVRAHIHEPPPSLAERNPSAPQGMDAVVRRVLSKDPARRYQSGAALAMAFEDALLADEHPTPIARPLPSFGPTPTTDPREQDYTRAQGPSDPTAADRQSPAGGIHSPFDAVIPGPPSAAFGPPGAATERWPRASQARRQGGGIGRGLLLVVLVALLATAAAFFARSTGLFDSVGSTFVSSPTRTPAPAVTATSAAPVATLPPGLSPTVPGSPGLTQTVVPGGIASPAASPAESPGPVVEVLPSVTLRPSTTPTSTPVPVTPSPTSDPRRGPLAVQIQAPADGARVPARPPVSGLRIGLQGPDEHLWMLIHPDGGPDNWWPYKREIITDRDGGWRIDDVEIGGPSGSRHVLAIGVVDAAGHQAILSQIRDHQDEPFVGGQPPGFRELARVTLVKQ